MADTGASNCRCPSEKRRFDSTIGRDLCIGCGMWHDVVFDERPSFKKDEDDVGTSANAPDSNLGHLTDVRVKSRFYNKSLRVFKGKNWDERATLSEMDRKVNGKQNTKHRHNRIARKYIDDFCRVLRLSSVVRNHAYHLWGEVNQQEIGLYRLKAVAAGLIYISALNHEQYQPLSMLADVELDGKDVNESMIKAVLYRFRTLFGIKRPAPAVFIKNVMYSVLNKLQMPINVVSLQTETEIEQYTKATFRANEAINTAHLVSLGGAFLYRAYERHTVTYRQCSQVSIGESICVAPQTISNACSSIKDFFNKPKRAKDLKEFDKVFSQKV
jgi:hypothetical protein